MLNASLFTTVMSNILPLVTGNLFLVWLWYLFLCRHKFVDRLKAIPHWMHLFGRSPVWIVIWSNSATLLHKAFLHTLHSKLLLPVCLLSCTLMFQTVLNLIGQCWHLYGFSPVWMRSCTSNWLFALKTFGQNVHCRSITGLWPLRRCGSVDLSTWSRWLQYSCLFW